MDGPPLWETEIPTRTSTGASLGFCSFVEASAHPHRRPDERLSQLKPARPQDIGSLLRLAMAWFRGLKIGRGYLREMGKDEARALVSTLSPARSRRSGTRRTSSAAHCRAKAPSA